MHVPLTLAVFLLLTTAIVLLRIFWSRLSPRTRRALRLSAGTIFVLFFLSFVSRWGPSSDRLNSVFYWSALLSYEFFVLLFTHLRPRWLTATIAVVLILPLFSASVFLPLTGLFDTSTHTVVSLDDNFLSERVPWGEGPPPTTGTDLYIYYQPPWMPLFRRHVQAARYFNGQCDASAAHATLQPDRKSVLMSCPAAPDQPLSSARNLIVKFY